MLAKRSTESASAAAAVVVDAIFGTLYYIAEWRATSITRPVSAVFYALYGRR